MGYVGILGLILILFGVIAVVSFYRQVTILQDEVLLLKAPREGKNPLGARRRYSRIKVNQDFVIGAGKARVANSEDQGLL